ncbi:MAG: GerMN domain-containing protein [Chloroherpetonaceae bacterium]|nr:GerMN domain-containing protein [Chthonomonadaceae bacterium]MDW8207492.1 GerMN domain-containing protein [Chloroherpetonaceae bacterium]
MKRCSSLLLRSGALVLALALCGCNRSEAPRDATPPAEPARPPAAATSQPLQDRPSPATLRDQVQAYLARHGDDTRLPRNVRLLEVRIEQGVVTLNFSKEFQQLANMGDTTEAEVQRDLRRLVGRFSRAERMRVTVEGGPFDSQMTDWSTPFPVRDTAQAEDLTQKPDSLEATP